MQTGIAVIGATTTELDTQVAVFRPYRTQVPSRAYAGTYTTARTQVAVYDLYYNLSVHLPLLKRLESLLSYNLYNGPVEDGNSLLNIRWAVNLIRFRFFRKGDTNENVLKPSSSAKENAILEKDASAHIKGSC